MYKKYKNISEMGEGEGGTEEGGEGREEGRRGERGGGLTSSLKDIQIRPI
jgi:hypothetical protein